MANAKIHRDKPMSRETAELLGVAFTWGGGVVAYRFARTDRGLTLQVRGVRLNSAGVPDEWRHATANPYVWDNFLLAKELVLVTFPDDAQTLEQR